MQWNMALVVLGIMTVGIALPRYVAKQSSQKQHLTVGVVFVLAAAGFFCVSYALHVPLVVIVGALVIAAVIGAVGVSISKKN